MALIDVSVDALAGAADAAARDWSAVLADHEIRVVIVLLASILAELQDQRDLLTAIETNTAGVV